MAKRVIGPNVPTVQTTDRAGRTRYTITWAIRRADGTPLMYPWYHVVVNGGVVLNTPHYATACAYIKWLTDAVTDIRWIPEHYAERLGVPIRQTYREAS